MGSNNVVRRKMIHSIKVGMALVIVSLLYMINSMYKQVGDNAMWAIMTVVVMFEFYAGGTLGKGINRGIGTIVGGGMGCLAAILANQIGGIGKRLTIAFSLFMFGCGATYCRLVPRLKNRYDYAFMISILTFNLVAVSGVHDAGNVIELALDRLATISMGFAVCISVSLFVFPIWATDELHCSTAAKFHKLADTLQGCLDDYFRDGNEKGNQGSDGSDYIQDCKSILNSKSNDDSLANFAKWEPFHGKFGQYYSWGKHLDNIGHHLRELATTILSLNQCLQSPNQPVPIKRQVMKEPCENFNRSIGWVLKELGQGIKTKDMCKVESSMNPKLQFLKLRLGPKMSCNCMWGDGDQSDQSVVAIAAMNFLLLEIVERVEKLVKAVDELGQPAKFQNCRKTSIDV